MTTPTPDFRALCAELLAELESEADGWNLDPEEHSLVRRARAALATPPPEPPTSMEILELSSQLWGDRVKLVRAALERWGNG